MFVIEKGITYKRDVCDIEKGITYKRDVCDIEKGITYKRDVCDIEKGITYKRDHLWCNKFCPLIAMSAIGKGSW